MWCDARIDTEHQGKTESATGDWSGVVAHCDLSIPGDGLAGRAGIDLPAEFQSPFLYAACFASFAAGFVSVEDDLLSDSI